MNRVICRVFGVWEYIAAGFGTILDGAGKGNHPQVAAFPACAKIHLFSLLLKLSHFIKIGTDLQFCIFCWVAIAFLIVVIENQWENRMMKQWFTPPINKIGPHVMFF